MTRLEEKDLRECYDFSTVLVDPPRAGLDDESVKAWRNRLQNYSAELIAIGSCLHDSAKEFNETMIPYQT